MKRLTLSRVKTFEDFERYLRHFHSWGDDPTLYDFGGVVALFVALLENLGQYGQGDLESLAYRLTDEQRALLKKITELATRMSDADIEREFKDVK